MIICPDCNTKNEEFFRFCRQCGRRLDEEVEPAAIPESKPLESTVRDLDVLDDPALAPTEAAEPEEAASLLADQDCEACGAQLLAGAAFCASCGAPVPGHEAVEDPQGLMPRTGRTMGRLVLIKDDGSDGDAHDLEAELTVLGRSSGHLVFEDDPFLADKHLEFAYQAGRLVVRPLESTNGVFIRLTEDEEVLTGDYIRVGQELLRFDSLDSLWESPDPDTGVAPLASRVSPEAWGRLSQAVSAESFGDCYILDADDVYLGRDKGHIQFPEDGYVSGSHAVLARRKDHVFLRDLNSSNGTYLRLRSSRHLVEGDVLLVGQQLFRVEPG